MTEISRVVVGVGDIEDGVRPLAWALAEARRRGAELHALRAWHAIDAPGPLTENWHDRLEQEARETLLSAVDIATGGVPPDFSRRLFTCQGDAADVLLRYADRDDDLLVLGTSRHRPWWPFGQKTVRKCVRKAGCAVVVVPQTAMARSMPVHKLLRELHHDLTRLERAGA